MLRVSGASRRTSLQSVYLNKVLLKKISDIMMEEMLPKVNKKDGRYGMDFWNIFVLHVVKRGASIDYDRLRDYANSHIELSTTSRTAGPKSSRRSCYVLVSSWHRTPPFTTAGRNIFGAEAYRK